MFAWIYTAVVFASGFGSADLPPIMPKAVFAGGLICVEAKADEQAPVYFVLDTGSKQTMITPKLSEQLKGKRARRRGERARVRPKRPPSGPCLLAGWSFTRSVVA